MGSNRGLSGKEESEKESDEKSDMIQALFWQRDEVQINRRENN